VSLLLIATGWRVYEYADKTGRYADIQACGNFLDGRTYRLDTFTVYDEYGDKLGVADTYLKAEPIARNWVEKGERP
jgi:hypothetical protein